MLKVLRLPSLKICTLLLSALFIYDIFFVFITPLITKNGKSIMVEVATGGDSGEQVPMVLRVPHLSCNDMKTCAIPYSMLGFGDILVPGLLLSYCHSFDLFVGTPCKLYWLISNICKQFLITFNGPRLKNVFYSLYLGFGRYFCQLVSDGICTASVIVFGSIHPDSHHDCRFDSRRIRQNVAGRFRCSKYLFFTKKPFSFFCLNLFFLLPILKAPSSLSGSTNHVDTRRDSTGQDAESVPAKEGVPVDGEIPEC